MKAQPHPPAPSPKTETAKRSPLHGEGEKNGVAVSVNNAFGLPSPRGGEGLGVRLGIILLACTLFAACIFKKPTQDNQYDVNCGGVTIESAESCFKLEVTEVIAISPPAFTTGGQNQLIQYYFKTTDNCYRDKNGAPQAGATQPGGTVCGMTPSAKVATALLATSVSFTDSCTTLGNVDAAGNFTTVATPANGSCNIPLTAAGGYKGKNPTATAVVSVSIGVSAYTYRINSVAASASFTTGSDNCLTDVATLYASTTVSYTDGATTTPLPAGGSWSYSGTGGSVDTTGKFTSTSSGSGTIVYAANTAKNIPLTFSFPVTIVDAIYVSSASNATPFGSVASSDAAGFGCPRKPYATVQYAVGATGNPLNRSVYVAVGDYSFDSQAGVQSNWGAGSVIMREGISVRGGYDTVFSPARLPFPDYHTACNAATMSCLIDNTTFWGGGSVNNRAVTAGSGVTSATLLEGFFISGTSSPPSGGSSINSAMFISGSGVTIANNAIFAGAPTSGAGTLTMSAVYLTSNATATLRNNYIHGGKPPVTAGGSSVTYGVYVMGGGAHTIINNVIEGGIAPGLVSYGIYYYNAADCLLTNNTIVSNWGSSVHITGDMGSVANLNARITNNIIAWAGTAAGINETESKSSPRSLENNAFYPLSAASVNLYNKYANLLQTTIASLEGQPGWVGGTDKARGNILLPAGAAGRPFANFPRFRDATTAAGTTTTLVVAGPANLYNDLDYVEINGDNTPRRITCGGTPCTLLTLTITLNPLGTASTSKMEVRNWGNNDNAGGLAYKITYNLGSKSTLGTQNGQYGVGQPSEQIWFNLVFGGKDTSGNNCGAPAGGPGTGAGGESCGQITSDKWNVARTPDFANLANNTNNGGVPGGYSIGAVEKD